MSRWHALAPWVLLVTATVAGCRSCDERDTDLEREEEGLVARQAQRDPAEQALIDGAPIAAVAARLPSRTGSCAQVRSVKEHVEAEAIAAAIEKAMDVPVALFRADLGERGVWWRLCVGDEDTEARLVARATRWTGPGGELEPFLDPPVDGAPRFFVQSRDTDEERAASLAQAKAIFTFDLMGGPEGEPTLWLAESEQPAALYLAGTVRTVDGASDAVVIDGAGRRLPMATAPAPGCAACKLALRERRVKARRVVGAGDVSPGAGEEILVEEIMSPPSARAASEATASALPAEASEMRLLSVFTVNDRTLTRRAGLVLDNARPGFVHQGTVSVVDADVDGHKELLLSTAELRVVGDAGCALEQHAAVFDIPDSETGLVRIDPRAPSADDDAIINVITALDAGGDHDAASRACAAQLARAPRPAVAQLCVQRARRLQDEGMLIEAVNAAGLLAEASPALRPVIAVAFLEAAVALDNDPRLFAGELSCDDGPTSGALVSALDSRPIAESFELARARARERVPLADLADAVFVSGARDFGPTSPVGAITARWLARARIALPARYAAIEALLLPQQEEQGLETVAPAQSNDMGPGFGGAP